MQRIRQVEPWYVEIDPDQGPRLGLWRRPDRRWFFTASSRPDEHTLTDASRLGQVSCEVASDDGQLIGYYLERGFSIAHSLTDLSVSKMVALPAGLTAVREATPSDLEELPLLDAQCRAAVPEWSDWSFDEPWFRMQMVSLREHGEDRVFLATGGHGEVVGYSWLRTYAKNSESASLWFVGVRPEWRRRGLGAALWIRAAEWGLSHADECCAQVRSSNYASLGAALKLGFRIVGTKFEMRRPGG